MVKQAKNLFDKAENAIKRRNFGYAIELLLQGLQLDPLNIEQRKRLRQTEVVAVQEKGGNPKGDLKTGITSLGTQWKIKKLGMKKKWEEQIIEIEKYLRGAPQNVPMLFNLAKALKQLENGKKASIAVLQTVVEADRSQVEAWRELGSQYASFDPHKAIECWEMVKKYKPEDKEAGKAIRDLSAATMVKNAEDRKKSGSGDFRDLLKDEDESQKLQDDQQIIRTDEDALKAIERLREKVAENPDEKRMVRRLGDLYRRVKNYDEAEKIFKGLLEKDATDLLAQERLGDLRESRFTDRVEELTEALKEKPDDADLKSQMDVAQKELDDYMVVELERRVKAHPTDCGLKAKFGTLLLKREMWDEAVEQFQKALNDPRFATQAHANLGKCFRAKRLYDLGIEEFSKALKAIPDTNSSLAKDVTYTLALTHADKGDYTNARVTMEKILSVDIRFRDVSEKVDEFRKKEQGQ